MEQRKIGELSVRVKDKKGKEAWVSISELNRVFIESVKEFFDLTFKEIGKK